jgi:activator of the mannose operon (transcriptional antiterminator)
LINLKKRHRAILKILIDNDGPVTTDHIASIMKVSTRTIRSDLQIIEEILDDFDIKLIRKPRVGIYLDAQTDKKIMLLEKLPHIGEYNAEPFDTQEREKYIISRLLKSNKTLTAQELADDLFVSRMTISNDLDNIEKWLNKHKLSLIRKPNYGTKITGNEENWRNAYADFIATYSKRSPKKIAVECGTNPLDKRLSTENIKQLRNLFPQIDVRKVERVILESEKFMNSSFAQESYTALVVHLVISIKRLKNKKDIKMPESQIKKIKETEEYNLAVFIANELEKAFDVKFPESEIGYISLHILGAKLQNEMVFLKEDDIEVILKDFDDDLIQIVYDIIQVTENILDVKLSNDKMLVTGLALHLRPVINRLKNGMNLHNPILDQIKENYTAIYGIAWIAAGIIENRLGIKVGEEEVGYLAMHLGAAIDRAKSPKKALVVCSSGIGTAQLLSSRLKKVLPDIILEDIVPSRLVQSIIQSKSIDLIITTIPLEVKGIPVAMISPLVTQADVLKIRSVIDNIGSINNIKIKQQAQSYKKGIVSNLIPQELIFCKQNYRKKEELIEKVGNILAKKGYVRKEFINTALEREKITSTYIGKGVAIPHGEDNLVIKPAVSVITLKEPIDWLGEDVDVVFYLALHFTNSQYTKSFFKEFYNMMDNPKLLKRIKEAKSSLEISEILQAGGES